jgi:thymidylate kinase
MQIVLEGPDNSGKSTLARTLADVTGRKIIKSEGPERHRGEVNTRIYRLLDVYKNEKVIFDRYPVISQQMYSVIKPNTPVKPSLIRQFYDSHPLIIYCRPDLSRGMQGHVRKEYDTSEYLGSIEKNYKKLCAAYDQWALEHATIIHRWGQSDLIIKNLVKEVVS